jgi:hypothetical protein
MLPYNKPFVNLLARTSPLSYISIGTPIVSLWKSIFFARVFPIYYGFSQRESPMLNMLDFIVTAVFFGVCLVLTGLFTIFIYPIFLLEKTLSSGRLNVYAISEQDK